MVQFDTLEVAGLDSAITGMRNPMKSWSKRDSSDYWYDNYEEYYIGPNDYQLAKSLCKAGSEHRKWMRQVVVWVDIYAPRLWWSEFDTYKVGTSANSESTMHRLMKDGITKDDLDFPWGESDFADNVMNNYLEAFDAIRASYHSAKENGSTELAEQYFLILKSMVPESFIQLRTVCLNYEVLHNMYHQRKNHRLPHWNTDFVSWVKTLPYNEFITEEWDEQ